MKKLVSIISLVLLMLALGAGIYLTRKNQETRRGAASADVVASFLPGSKDLKSGETIGVLFVINTGSTVDKMVGLEAKVSYDRSKLKYINSEVQPGLTFLTEDGTAHPIDKGSGDLDYRIVAMGNEPGGVVNVAKINFQVLDGATGVAEVAMNSGAVTIRDQASAWNISNIEKASYTLNGAGTTTPPCRQRPACLDAVRFPCKIPEPASGWCPIVTCTDNSQCSDATVCVSGKCDVPVCSTTIPECKKTAYINHACVLVNGDSGIACSTSGVPGGEVDGKCESGTCVKTVSCTDSDGGKNYTTKGTTSGKDDAGVTVSYTDSCVVGGVREYYCENNIVKMETHACGSGFVCNDGACVAAGVSETPVPLAPTATDVPTNGSSRLNFKFSYDGVAANNTGCLVDWPIKVMVLGSNGETKSYDAVGVRETGIADRAVFKASVALTGFQGKTGLAVFVKGAKHLQMKYGIDKQNYFYNKAGGQISVTDPNYVYDFSNYPLMAGDVTGDQAGVPDGTVDGRDFSYIKAIGALPITDKRRSSAKGGNLQADLDGNCFVNVQDVTLLMKSLADRQEQLY